MLQTLLDDFVDANLTVQTFLAEPNNLNKTIRITIDDIDKSFLVLCQYKQLLLLEALSNPLKSTTEKDARHDTPTVSIKGSLASLYKLSSIQHLSPATIQTLGIAMVGDMGFLLRFAEMLKSVSLKSFFNVQMSKQWGSVTASSMTEKIDLFREMLKKTTDSLKKQGQYIASQTHIDKKIVLESDVEKMHEELYQQHIQCQKLQQKIALLQANLERYND